MKKYDPSLKGLAFPKGPAKRKGKGGLTEFSCLLQ
jgi:hypothetical protein